MRNLSLLAVLAIPVFSFAGEGDSQELIERIESSAGVVIIKHEVRSDELDGKKFAMTFGTIVDASGVERKAKLARVYNCDSSIFPTHITRNADNPAPHEIDQYLVFEKESGGDGSVQSHRRRTMEGRSSYTSDYKLYAFKLFDQDMTLMIGKWRPDDPHNQPGLAPVLLFQLYRCHHSLFPPVINYDEYGDPEPVTDQYLVLTHGYELDDERGPDGQG